MKALLLASCVLLLAHCGDRQQKAMHGLKAHGYSLSIAEYHRAAREGALEPLQLMLRAGTQVDVTDGAGRTALAEAAAHGHLEAVALLLEAGAKVVSGRMGSLDAAVKGRNGDIIRLLLQRDPSLIKDAQSLMPDLAAAADRHAVAAMLEQPGLIADTRTLIAAAEGGDTGVIDLLLQSGASPWEGDPSTGETPLMRAASLNQMRAAELLLNAPASRFAADKTGRIALDYAQTKEMRSKLSQAPSEAEQSQRQALPKAQATSALSEVASSSTDELLRFDGAVVIGAGQPAEELILKKVFQASLPVMMIGIDSGKLSLSTGERIAIGQRLPGTTWILRDLRSRVDAAWSMEALLRDEESRQHVMIPGVPAHSGPLCAECASVTHPGHRYEGQVGDSFMLGGRTWRVTSIRPDRVVMESEGISSVVRWAGR